MTHFLEEILASSKSTGVFSEPSLPQVVLAISKEANSYPFGGQDLKQTWLSLLAFAKGQRFVLTRESSSLNIIACPKNGCTTLKYSFSGDEADPETMEPKQLHKWIDSRYARNPIDIDKPFLIVTRNPYTRVVSGFLDKVVRGRIPIPGLINTDPTLENFITTLYFLRQTNPYEMNPHFRPQVITLLHGCITPQYVCRFEAFDEIKSIFREHDITLKSYRGHQTNSSLFDKLVTPEASLLIQEIYQSDFDAYQYPRSYKSSEKPKTLIQKQEFNQELRAGLDTWRQNAGNTFHHFLESTCFSPSCSSFRTHLYAGILSLRNG